MKIWILAVVVVVVATTATLYALRPPDLEEARAKHGAARDILSGLMRGMSEWKEEEKKLGDELDAQFEIYKQAIARKDALADAYRFARAPEVIAEMEKNLAAEIADMEKDMAAWKADRDLHVRKLTVLQAEAEHAPPERAADLRSQIDRTRKARDDISKIVEEAGEDLRRARSILKG